MNDEVETIERNPKSWAAWKREAERLQGELNAAEAALSAANEKLSKPVVLPRVAAIHAALTDVARHRTSVQNIRDVVEAIKAAGGKVEGE